MKLCCNWIALTGKMILYCYISMPLATAGHAVKSGRHPIHVATTDLSFNSQDDQLEGTCTLFTDDFEAVLEKQYHTKVDLTKADMHKGMDVLVRNYVNANLRVKSNDAAIALKYLGFEIDHEAVNIYLESDKITPPGTLNVTVGLLYDLYDDQINIVHLSVKGVRKSRKISYPDKPLSKVFKGLRSELSCYHPIP